MAHAWKACWVQALGGSNPPSSATNPGPSGSGFFHALFTPASAYSRPRLYPIPTHSPDPLLLPAHLVQAPALLPALLFLDDAAPYPERTAPQSAPSCASAPSDIKNPATHCMTGIDGGSAGIRTRGGLHHTAFRVLHLRPLGHATSAAQSTGDYSQYANLTYPATVTQKLHSPN